MANRWRVTYGLVPCLLFLAAFGTRWYFFQGFVLGDDWEEFYLMRQIVAAGPDFYGHLQHRVGLWIVYVLSMALLGGSEVGFFLPTLVLSSTVSVVAYLLLLLWRYPPSWAALGACLVASSPFEVLLGTLHTNDLVLEWLLALALLLFVVLGNRPLTQGLVTGFLCWAAFYVKLWVVYLFPAIGVYYGWCVIKRRSWPGFVGFAVSTATLHAISSFFWKYRLGVFFPFFTQHSATYPVEPRDLGALFWQYPKMLLIGSEFGTTLFGYIPYLAAMLLLGKLVFSLGKKRFARLPTFDSCDVLLVGFYGSFAVFLNFFPNSFQFDAYYSAPRIFRYLAPLSFPLSLHLVKMVMDFARTRSVLGNWILWAVVGSGLLTANFVESAAATSPGRVHHRILRSVVADIKAAGPPRIVAEKWVGFFLKEVYLQADDGIEVVTPEWGIHGAQEHERWLLQRQETFPEGTLLLSGLGSYVHYGAHSDGFRLRRFLEPLDPRWRIFGEYETLFYLPLPERGYLWRWSESR